MKVVEPTTNAKGSVIETWKESDQWTIAGVSSGEKSARIFSSRIPGTKEIGLELYISCSLEEIVQKILEDEEKRGKSTRLLMLTSFPHFFLPYFLYFLFKRRSFSSTKARLRHRKARCFPTMDGFPCVLRLEFYARLRYNLSKEITFKYKGRRGVFFDLSPFVRSKINAIDGRKCCTQVRLETDKRSRSTAAYT